MLGDDAMFLVLLFSDPNVLDVMPRFLLHDPSSLPAVRLASRGFPLRAFYGGDVDPVNSGRLIDWTRRHLASMREQPEWETTKYGKREILRLARCVPGLHSAGCNRTMNGCHILRWPPPPDERLGDYIFRVSATLCAAT